MATEVARCQHTWTEELLRCPAGLRKLQLLRGSCALTYWTFYYPVFWPGDATSLFRRGLERRAEKIKTEMWKSCQYVHEKKVNV
jgi:hypothetical protein